MNGPFICHVGTGSSRLGIQRTGRRDCDAISAQKSARAVGTHLAWSLRRRESSCCSAPASTTSSAKQERGYGLTTPSDAPSTQNDPALSGWSLTALRHRLSTVSPTLSMFQSLVGLTTGLISIGGVLFALPSLFNGPPPQPSMGQISRSWRKRRRRSRSPMRRSRS